MLIAEVMTGLNPRNYPHFSTSFVMMNCLHLTWEETPTAGGTMGAVQSTGSAPGAGVQGGSGWRIKGKGQANY